MKKIEINDKYQGMSVSIINHEMFSILLNFIVFDRRLSERFNIYEKELYKRTLKQWILDFWRM